MLRNIIIIAWSASICIASSVDLPGEIKKCRFGDYTCMKKSANQFIRKYAKGNPAIGLDPLNLVKIDDVSLINSPGPIWISYKLKNQMLRGFENFTMTNMSGFEYRPENTKMIIEGIVPRLIMEGEYEFQGRGLIVYSNTTGKTNSELLNVHLTASVKGYFQFRNNKRYFKIYDVVPQIKIDRWILWADDLYKENTDLTVILNQVVNENWLEFWNEIEPTILPVYGRSIYRIIARVMETVAYDDMFLPRYTT